jgi:hypothetical protein
MKIPWSKKIGSLIVRNGLSSLVFIICTMIPTVLLSYLLNKPEDIEKSGPLENLRLSIDSGQFFRTSLILWGAIALSIFLTYLFAKRQHKQIMRLTVSSSNKRIAWTALFAFSTIVVIVFLTFYFGGDSESLRRHAGGVFDIVLGFFSLAGIYLTLAEVLDIRNSIVSFRDLLNRIEVLIKETPKNDKISMMILTPAMGCMVLPFKEWNRIGELVKSQDHHVSLTCLNDQEMAGWFNSYILLSDSTDDTSQKLERISSGIAASKSILSELRRNATELGHDLPVEGSFENFSRAYLIANRVRAIVAVPLYMPTTTYQPNVDDHYNKRVQFIGFETQDFHLIESITEEIAMRRTFFETANGAQAVTNPAGANGVGIVAIPPSNSDAAEIVGVA